MILNDAAYTDYDIRRLVMAIDAKDESLLSDCEERTRSAYSYLMSDVRVMDENRAKEAERKARWRAKKKQEEMSRLSTSISGQMWDKRDNVPNVPVREERRGEENNISNINITNISNNTITRKSKRFVPPSVEEVDEYCRSRNNTISGEAFVSFYESKGWLIGKSPMKDWKAAVRTWEQHRANSQSIQTTVIRPTVRRADNWRGTTVKDAEALRRVL
jgi:hypothetical protein